MEPVVYVHDESFRVNAADPSRGHPRTRSASDEDAASDVADGVRRDAVERSGVEPAGDRDGLPDPLMGPLWA